MSAAETCENFTIKVEHFPLENGAVCLGCWNRLVAERDAARKRCADIMSEREITVAELRDRCGELEEDYARMLNVKLDLARSNQENYDKFRAQEKRCGELEVEATKEKRLREDWEGEALRSRRGSKRHWTHAEVSELMEKARQYVNGRTIGYEHSTWDYVSEAISLTLEARYAAMGAAEERAQEAESRLGIETRRRKYMQVWGRYLGWGYAIAPLRGPETLGVRCSDEGYYQHGGKSSLYKDHGWDMTTKPIPEDVVARTEEAAIDAAMAASENDPEFPRNDGFLQALQAKVNEAESRAEKLRIYVEEDAAEPCEYGCNCPPFEACYTPRPEDGSRRKSGCAPHGPCRSCCARAALSPEGQKPEPPADEMTLRSLLWAGHAGEDDGHYRYGDDGELQCSGIDGTCDFRREPVAKIQEHIEKRGWRLMSGGQKPEAPEVMSCLRHGTPDCKVCDAGDAWLTSLKRKPEAPEPPSVEPWQVPLWDAINRYAVSCGGHPERFVYGNTPRQKHVAEVDAIVRGERHAGCFCKHCNPAPVSEPVAVEPVKEGWFWCLNCKRDHPLSEAPCQRVMPGAGAAPLAEPGLTRESVVQRLLEWVAETPPDHDNHREYGEGRDSECLGCQYVALMADSLRVGLVVGERHKSPEEWRG